MIPYTTIINPKTFTTATHYFSTLRASTTPGRHLQTRLAGTPPADLSDETLLNALLNTKKPCIFAESDISGDGSDWTREELGILGDIGMAVPVTVYDNGSWDNPIVHSEPFQAALLFTPGALLCNGRGQTPADWDAVTSNNQIDPEKYYTLYERRLLPLFQYADRTAGTYGAAAFITIPGIGCGQFAGPFRGQMGGYLEQALHRFLQTHGQEFSHIRAVYYDPHSECENLREEIHGISFMVRPLKEGNERKPQLCHPRDYEEPGDDFSQCRLFSFVAWDHVSWPGNDYYAGSRNTDDGVKAAATNSMAVITGIEGRYDPEMKQYQPPEGYGSWGEVVERNRVRLA